MPKSTREEKIAKYRKALEMKKAAPSKAWTQVLASCGSTTSYIYIDPEKVTDNQLDPISKVINLFISNADVKIAFRDYMIKEFNLIDPLSINDQSFKFGIGSLTDEELLHELKRRDYCGKLERKVKVITTEAVDW